MNHRHITHPPSGLFILQTSLLSLSSSPFRVLCDYSLTMVGSTLALRSKMASPSAMQLSSLSRRSLTTRSPVQTLRTRQSVTQQVAQRAARRPYSDAPPAAPAPKPRKRFRFFRWTWRLTLLAGVGLAGQLAYSIYDQRHPIEQTEADPNKKTLVVLGKLPSRIDFGRKCWF